MSTSRILLEQCPEISTHMTKPAQRVLTSLDRSTQKRILARIRELSRAPFDSRISSRVILGGAMRKSRVGNWRIFYVVENGTGTIAILAIRIRAQAYKNF